MGIFDDVASAVNRGTAAAGREADKLKIKSRMNEITKQRQGLAAQLGASLYEATRNNSELRSGREALYDGIAQLDAERDECQRQLADIEAQAAAATASAQVYQCPKCGSAVGANDLFCSGCGTPADQIRISVVQPAAPAPTVFCMNCGAPMGASDTFCMSCGTPRVQQGGAATGNVAEPAVQPAPAEEAPAAGESAAAAPDSQ